MNTLDELKALVTPAKRHVVEKAYELGKNELHAILEGKRRPNAGFFGLLPDMSRAMAQDAVFAELRSFQLPTYAKLLTREYKAQAGQMMTRNTQERRQLQDMLLGCSRFADNTRARTDLKTLVDDYGALLWEAAQVIMGAKDPLEAVAVLQLYAAGEIRIEGSETPLNMPETTIAA